ncbi:hypothetical protein D3C76_1651160 [compost metagenome]
MCTLNIRVNALASVSGVSASQAEALCTMARKQWVCCFSSLIKARIPDSLEKSANSVIAPRSRRVCTPGRSLR